MIERDYFSHDTKGRNEDACERIRRYGYAWRVCGENIGSYPDPDSMFNAWMGSSGHRANILSAKSREVGIGARTPETPVGSRRPCTRWTSGPGDRTKTPLFALMHPSAWKRDSANFA
jgi:cysteine-rich secretory family protein